MSASYISLVESGRRTPSVEIAQAIADNLGADLGELTMPEDASMDRDGRLGLVSRLIAARSARDGGDYAQAREILVDITKQFGGPDEEDAVWEARWELAETLDCLGEDAERAQLLRELLEDPLTTRAAHLHAKVAATLSHSARRGGLLMESVRHAERAMSAAEPLDVDSVGSVNARLALISAYADIGQWERAAELTQELLDVVDDVVSQQLRGVALWTAAAVLTLVDQADRAGPLAERGGALLRPEVDVRLWARFKRSAASLSVAIGQVGEAATPLRQARQALELVGTEADLAMLNCVEAMAHQRRGDVDGALAAVERGTGAQPRLPAQHRARHDLAAARALAAAGRASEAGACYRSAAAHYENAGAYRLATHVWREAADAPAITGSSIDHHAVLVP